MVAAEHKARHRTLEDCTCYVHMRLERPILVLRIGNPGSIRTRAASQNWKTHYDVRQRSNSGQHPASGLPVYHLWFIRKDELAWVALRLSQGSGVALSVERSQNVEQLEWQTQWDIREHTSFI